MPPPARSRRIRGGRRRGPRPQRRVLDVERRAKRSRGGGEGPLALGEIEIEGPTLVRVEKSIFDAILVVVSVGDCFVLTWFPNLILEGGFLVRTLSVLLHLRPFRILRVLRKLSNDDAGARKDRRAFSLTCVREGEPEAGSRTKRKRARSRLYRRRSLQVENHRFLFCLCSTI